MKGKFLLAFLAMVCCSSTLVLARDNNDINSIILNSQETEIKSEEYNSYLDKKEDYARRKSQELSRLEELKRLEEQPKETYLGEFQITHYCKCEYCCGEWAEGGVTASGTIPTSGRTIAMYGLPFGSKLKVNGVIYIIEDRGTPYGHIDMFCDSHSEALNNGMYYTDVYLVE